MKHIYSFKLADVTFHPDIRPIYQDHNALVCMKIQPRQPQTVSKLTKNYLNWAKKIKKLQSQVNKNTKWLIPICKSINILNNETNLFSKIILKFHNKTTCQKLWKEMLSDELLNSNFLLYYLYQQMFLTNR